MPDCTVGTGITPAQLTLVDCYHRSGIAPCPWRWIIY